jgi:hypothetical protein
VVLQIPVEPEIVISYFAPLLAVPTPHLSLLLQLKDDPNVVKRFALGVGCRGKALEGACNPYQCTRPELGRWDCLKRQGFKQERLLGLVSSLPTPYTLHRSDFGVSSVER